MHTVKINYAAIRELTSKLKQSYLRKRGIVLRVRARVGFETWDGTKRSLQRIVEKLLVSRPNTDSTAVFVHVTHPAIAERDCSISTDITRYVIN